MRMQWRRRQLGELDHELIWLAVSGATAAATSAWLALHLPWPECTFHALFGIPCATCGATRAALAFLHGDVAAAFRFNPMAAAAYLCLAAFDLYALAVICMRLPRVRISLSNRRARRTAIGILVTASLLNWAYLISTN